MSIQVLDLSKAFDPTIDKIFLFMIDHHVVTLCRETVIGLTLPGVFFPIL